MTTVTIFGASDDLIEIEGDLSEEFNPTYDADGPSYLAFTDGTVLSVKYGGDGAFWRINRITEGSAAYEKTEGKDEDDDYSDRVTLTGDAIKGVVFGDRFEKIKPKQAGGRQGQ